MKTTESSSLYDSLETKSTLELLQEINAEDQKVALAVQKEISKIEAFVDEAFKRFKEGGRLFYIGAGTSGRLGVVDASEIPPTFGMPHERVIGIIAGGDSAIRKAVEFAEDNPKQAWIDLETHQIQKGDILVGIAASGTTPYVVGGLKDCQENNISTACIVCNENSPLSEYADFKIEVIVGPEFLTGSSRLKAGTAQKLILNMISTISMILDGHVRGNKMIDMQMSNAKLNKRARRILMEELGVDEGKADELILKYKSIRLAIDNFNNE